MPHHPEPGQTDPPTAGTDLGRAARQRAFAHIHAANAWANGESVSGPGSTVERASLFRADLEALLRELNIGSLLDAGCGDCNWLPRFDLGSIHVLGADIVPELIAANGKRHPEIDFHVADIVSDPLPRADLILCRDTLGHLPNADVMRALANFRRSGATWLLTNTFVSHDRNPDIVAGSWRPLNLQVPPFNLSAPSRMVDERCLGHQGIYRDKRLGLWQCCELPV
jgi:SAM-dependent methyltransferase